MAYESGIVNTFKNNFFVLSVGLILLIIAYSFVDILNEIPLIST